MWIAYMTSIVGALQFKLNKETNKPKRKWVREIKKEKTRKTAKN